MKHMKQILILTISVCFLVGCKKAIQKTQEQIAEDIIVTAVTDGRWTVTAYNDGTDLLSEFTGYEFQFKKDRTVDAIKATATESTGVWQGDGLKREITSDYPNTASPTLQRLDGLWKIADNNWTWVKATQTINGKLTTLELRKK
jgi:NADPH-dependent glutamate synthase beta subunit-like oxidoreductase